MIIIKNTLKREFFHYFKFGNFLILYNAVGLAKMKHATDVRISKSPAFSSMNIPPINTPTALFMLLMKRYASFANSGASLIDEPNQYWEIVCIEPSIMPKRINCTNVNPGTLIPRPKNMTTTAKTIGYSTIGRLFLLPMKYPKRLVPQTAAIPLANRNIDIKSAGILVRTSSTTEK